VEYGQGIGADGVIFTTVPYDRYFYTFVSNLDRDRVGTTFEIDIPQAPQFLFVDRDFFNHVANAGQWQITSDLLKDRPYEIDSYPRCTDSPVVTTSNDVPLDLGAGVHVYSTIEPMGQVPDPTTRLPFPPQMRYTSASTRPGSRSCPPCFASRTPRPASARARCSAACR
jgi:hypothetical protein